MSPIGLLLLTECDNQLRIDLASIRFCLSAMGVEFKSAICIAKYLGLEVHEWLN